MALSREKIEEINSQFAYLEQGKQMLEMENQKLRSNLSQMSTAPPDDNSELAKLQLDCDKQLDQIYHNLSNHILIKTRGGGDDWQEPEDEELKILTKNGVHLLMNELRIHVNPITLLSNYKPEMVEIITCDFGRRLNQLLFCKAEFFFHHKKPDELFEKYLPFLTNNMTQDQLYEMCVEESQKELKRKQTHQRTIVFGIMELVYSTYLRAVGGEERKRLREKQVFHTSQTINPNQIPVKRGLFG